MTSKVEIGIQKHYFNPNIILCDFKSREEEPFLVKGFIRDVLARFFIVTAQWFWNKKGTQRTPLYNKESNAIHRYLLHITNFFLSFCGTFFRGQSSRSFTVAASAPFSSHIEHTTTDFLLKATYNKRFTHEIHWEDGQIWMEHFNVKCNFDFLINWSHVWI